MLTSQRLRIPAAVFLALALSLPPLAAARAESGWHGYNGHRHHGHRYKRRHHGHHHGDSDAAIAVGVVLGGVLLATLLAHSLADEPAPAVPVAEPLRLGNCKPTTGRQRIDGRWALLSGTWCTDQYGRGYILDDSVRFVRYLN